MTTILPTPIAPRAATPSEVAAIHSAATEDVRYTDQIARNMACCAVFDHYTATDNSYTGPVAVVIWAGNPSLVTTYIKLDVAAWTETA